jgi:hypothetical protein
MRFLCDEGWPKKAMRWRDGRGHQMRVGVSSFVQRKTNDVSKWR